jgi:hypothetical protein
MKFMSGWTWYCEYHDSFGIGDTELEVQHMANAHTSFYLKSGNPCLISKAIKGDQPNKNPINNTKYLFIKLTNVLLVNDL